MKAQIGIIGLAVMGSNLARNFASKKITTAVYNRTAETTDTFINEHGNDHLISAHSLEDFVATLEKPRKIILLVKSGPAVDAVIESLTPLLEPEDTIIDFGNSFYRDTQRRAQQLTTKKLHYFGCGISGGEKGALNGPSLMPGGSQKTWKQLQPLLEAVAAKDFNDKPCVAYLGPGGAGHYVKMVHNGIEYGIMQILAEACQFLKLQLHMPPSQIAQVFNRYNQSKLNSFLCELTAQVLAKKDDQSSDPLIDKILDKAAQKGTGTWTAIDAFERGIPTPTINQAVIARTISSFKDLRINLEKIYPNLKKRDNLDTDKTIDMLDDAIYSAIILTFAQGFDLIAQASREEKWETNLAEVARIWQGGCIIRAKLLSFIEKDLRDSNSNPTSVPHLLQLPSIKQELTGNLKNLRELVSIAAINEIPAPALSSTLTYFDNITQQHGSASLIQALRDAFGSHTYERTDQTGNFHTEW